MENVYCRVRVVADLARLKSEIVFVLLFFYQYLRMTSSTDLTRPVWYILYQYAQNGSDIRVIGEDAIRLSGEAFLFEFRKAVRHDSAYQLAGVDATALELYADYESFEANKKTLNVKDKIESLGIESLRPIVVLAPRSVGLIVSPKSIQIVDDSRVVPNAPLGTPIGDVNISRVAGENRVPTILSPSVVTGIVWREPEPPGPCSLDEGVMRFVDREDAAWHLIEAHKKNFGRSINQIPERGCASRGGFDWACPIIVNDSGCGKTRFAYEYPRMVRGLLGDDEMAAKVEAAICIAISLEDMDRKSSYCDEFVRLVTVKLRGMIENFTMIEHQFMGDSSHLFTQLIALGGKPVYLIVDEIGAPFKHPDEVLDSIQAHQEIVFNEFVTAAILPIVRIPNLFLLLCGKSRFLDRVGALSRNDQHVSVMEFERIVLHSIRPSHISEILSKTQVRGRGSLETVAFRLGLTDEQKLKSYSEELYKLTGGHPRTLGKILRKRCDWVAQYGRPGLVQMPPETNLIGSIEVRMLEERISQQTEVACFLLDACETDKAVSVTAQNGLGRAFMEFLPGFRIGYELEPDDMTFKVTMSSLFRILFALILNPVNEFLSSFTSSQIPYLGHSLVLERLVRSAFNQLLGQPCCPGQRCPQFFASKVFGALGEFVCTQVYRDFPKVTSKSTNTSLRGKTVNPSDASRLIDLAFDEMTENATWFTPDSESASPDLLHLSMVGAERRLVMIAVKNFAFSTLMGIPRIKQEIKLAETMVPGGPGRPKHCILLILSTQYTAEIAKQFGPGQNFYVVDGLSSILDEVVLLDITSTEARNQFFGVSGKAAANLESLIAKGKAV